VKGAIGIAKLLEELGFTDEQSGASTIKALQDNKSTIIIAEAGEGYTAKSKHFQVRFNFLKDLLESGKLTIEYCPTDLMTADYLTKSLGADALFAHLSTVFGVDHQRR
jgi:hypothetical protein